MSTIDLSVVIVNYNVREFLAQALRTVEQACAGLDAEIFVVDNNSADGSVAMVRERFPNVCVIANTENVGFGRANNQAMLRARGRYLMILNPDTVVQEDTFRTMIRFMEAHPDCGAVGCRILNPDGTFARESRRAFPSPDVAFYRISGLSRLFPKSRRFGRYNLTYLPIDQVAEVDALSGSCMLVRRAALWVGQARAAEAGTDPDTLTPWPAPGQALPYPDPADGGAGLFDEDFFMYGEDLDWCFRIKEAGWKIYYTPDTQIIHYKGESTKKGELRYVRLFYGAMAQFVQKHFHDRYSRLFAGMLHVGIGVRATQTVLGNWAKRVRQPLAEWVLAFAVLCVVAKVRSLPVNFSFSPFFYYAVAPIYALVITTSIGLFGGYRSRRRRRVRPAVLGVTWAFLATVVASFFVKSVAFSRIVVLVGYALAGVGIVVLRFVLAERSERRIGRRQAVVVGPPEEAQAFQNHLVGLRQAPLDVIGFVWDEPLVRAAPVQTVPRLGGLNQIRDIVRLQHVDDLVFPAEGVPNGVVLKLLRELNDLSVDFKMLAEGREHVIGKSYIGALTDGPSVVEAESRIHLPRSRMARRLADVPLALLGGLAGVFVRWPAPQAGTPRARFVELWQHVPSVVTGRRALVGYDPAGSFIPPPEWGIEEGASPILSDAEAVSASRLRDAYWAYTQRQSAWTDLRLVARWIRGNA